MRASGGTLSFQIQRGLSGLRIEWDRVVFVDDEPAAFAAAEARGGAPPHVELGAVDLRGGDVIQAVREGDVVRRGDVNVPALELDRAGERAEPFASALLAGRDAARFERADDVILETSGAN